MNNTTSTEIHYRLLKLLESNPNLTQRRMAEEMGLSLGKFNYCLRELVRKGVVKIERFKSSSNKVGYLYVLTPHGMEQKTKITTAFLHRKMQEFENIKKQIKELSNEAGQTYIFEGDNPWPSCPGPHTPNHEP